MELASTDPLRRSLLVGLAMLPAFNTISASAGSPKDAQTANDLAPIPVLRRSREKRALSRVRYHNAEEFLRGLTTATLTTLSGQLYTAGIVLQLGLTSHLLDVGFDDAWCVRHIGLDISKALQHANATGLAMDDHRIADLASILSPYSRWRHGRREPRCGEAFTVSPVHETARALLDQVRDVTGHSRPRRMRNLL